MIDAKDIDDDYGKNSQLQLYDSKFYDNISDTNFNFCLLKWSF